MTVKIASVTFDCADALAVGRFLVGCARPTRLGPRAPTWRSSATPGPSWPIAEGNEFCVAKDAGVDTGVSEQGWREFLAAEGVDDWVVLHGGATAVFRVGSLGEAARLAEAVAQVPGLEARARCSRSPTTASPCG